MTKLTAAAIEGERRALKSRLDELLKCDELWNNKLTSDILEAARNELDGHRDILDDKSERYDQISADRDHFFLLRDLIVSGMASKLLLAWARNEESRTANKGVIGYSLNLLSDSWEVTVYTETEQDLATIVKFAEEEGLQEIHKMNTKGPQFSVVIPKGSFSKFFEFIYSRPDNDILPH